MHHR
jgi:hypothetical protein